MCSGVSYPGTDCVQASQVSRVGVMDEVSHEPRCSQEIGQLLYSRPRASFASGFLE